MKEQNFIIQWPHKPDLSTAYVLKEGGWNHRVEDPRLATFFETRDEAKDARPGHGKEMGGAGYVGHVIPRDGAIRDYVRC